MKIEIVRANKNEFDNLMPLIEELWPKLKFNKKKLRSIYASQIGSNKIFLFAKIKDKIIGFISISFRLDILGQGKIGLIEEFIVTKKYQGNGVGKKLMSSICKIAKKEKCVGVELYSNTKRAGAYRFYEKQGFKSSAKFFWKILK